MSERLSTKKSSKLAAAAVATALLLGGCTKSSGEAEWSAGSPAATSAAPSPSPEASGLTEEQVARMDKVTQKVARVVGCVATETTKTKGGLVLQDGKTYSNYHLLEQQGQPGLDANEVMIVIGFDPATDETRFAMKKGMGNVVEVRSKVAPVALLEIDGRKPTPDEIVDASVDSPSAGGVYKDEASSQDASLLYDKNSDEVEVTGMGLGQFNEFWLNIGSKADSFAVDAGAGQCTGGN